MNGLNSAYVQKKYYTKIIACLTINSLMKEFMSEILN